MLLPRDQVQPDVAIRAPPGLITSDGFRDLPETSRQQRPDVFDLQAGKPPVLVKRQLRPEVPSGGL